jgi:hypothetical protein
MKSILRSNINQLANPVLLPLYSGYEVFCRAVRCGASTSGPRMEAWSAAELQKDTLCSSSGYSTVSARLA